MTKRSEIKWEKVPAHEIQVGDQIIDPVRQCGSTVKEVEPFPAEGIGVRIHHGTGKLTAMAYADGLGFPKRWDTVTRRVEQT